MRVSLRHPLSLASHLHSLRQQGASEARLALEEGLKLPTVKKYLWIASLPEELRTQMAAHPEVFTARVLLNGFASRRKYWTEGGFAKLKREIEKLIAKGPGHTPRKALCYPKGRAGGSLVDQRQRQKQKAREFSSSYTTKRAEIEPPTLVEQMRAQGILREALMLPVKVTDREIRVEYFGRLDLEEIVRTISAISVCPE